MNYDTFSAARDIFYLGSILLGSACGLFTGAFSPSKTLKERSACITISLYVLTAFIVCAAAALCIEERIIYNYQILIIALIYAVIFFFAFFFPAALRFSLVMVLSLIVLTTLYFYRIGIPFNSFKIPIARIDYDGADRITVKPAYNKIHIFSTAKVYERGITIFYDKRYNDTVKYALCFIQAGRALPVFGGGRRVILLSITVEQTEPGRAVRVFWSKPMEETFLGTLLSRSTELLNSTSAKVFAPPGRSFMEMQIIYGKAKFPAVQDGQNNLVLQNQFDNWREIWME
ncbi:MAG: hypothetical protein LBG74_00755 [Spirochaetaceae bacterium]|jgi:hypothetical protein|nr:hypothetical protein [Spirochaetaceae bacterium]